MTRKNSNSRIPNGETTRTLPEPDADEVMAQYRAYLRILLLKALKALEDGLDSDDPRVKLASATKILQGVGFFQGGGMDTILSSGLRRGRIGRSADRHGLGRTVRRPRYPRAWRQRTGPGPGQQRSLGNAGRR